MTGVIFQGNPKEFNIDQYLKTRKRIRWLVNQHRREIGPGDTAFIWRSDGGVSQSGGLVGVGRVLTPPAAMEDDAPEFWTKPPRSRLALRVEILLDEVRLDIGSGMLLRTELKREAPLQDMLILRFANKTNFILDPAHTTCLLSLWSRRS